MQASLSSPGAAGTETIAGTITTEVKMAPSVMGAAELRDILTIRIGLEKETVEAAGDASLSELGADSVGIIELQKVIADEYGVELPDEAAAMTLQNVLACVNAQTGEGD